MIALIGIIAIIHSAVYVTTRNFVESEITLCAQAVAISVALHITDDIEAYKSFLTFVDQYRESQGVEPGEKVDPMPYDYLAQDKENYEYYKKVAAYFAEIIEGTHFRYIYTVRKLNDDYVEFILDGAPFGCEEHHSPPGDTDDQYSYTLSAFATGQPSRFGLTHYDQWSYLLGAYVPIVDGDGNLLGLVGVNICGTHLNFQLNRKHMVLLVVYLSIVGLGVLILTRYSGTILDPLLKDKLTGAYNKRYAEKLIQDEIAIAIREHSDLALMVLDLDHFKNINDTYGHNFGDKVLTSVSQTVQSALRHRDYFIRYGGEEFIALFPKANAKSALEIAERIRHAVEGSKVFNEEQDIFVKVTISIGVTTLAFSSPTALEFIHHADKALYVAKKTRNSVSFYSHEAEVLLSDVSERDSYLQSAITRRKEDVQ